MIKKYNLILIITIAIILSLFLITAFYKKPVKLGPSYTGYSGSGGYCHLKDMGTFKRTLSFSIVDRNSEIHWYRVDIGTSTGKCDYSQIVYTNPFDYAVPGPGYYFIRITKQYKNGAETVSDEIVVYSPYVEGPYCNSDGKIVATYLKDLRADFSQEPEFIEAYGDGPRYPWLYSFTTEAPPVLLPGDLEQKTVIFDTDDRFRYIGHNLQDTLTSNSIDSPNA